MVFLRVAILYRFYCNVQFELKDSCTVSFVCFNLLQLTVVGELCIGFA